MSVPWPWNPPDTWWIRIFEFGSAMRFPFVPPARMSAPIDIAAREILRMRERLNEILVHHTGQPVKRIQEDTERDYIMSADQGKEYGIIDDVIRKRV